MLPRLDGKLSGDSIREPVPVGSIGELNTTVARDVTRDEVLTCVPGGTQTTEDGSDHDPACIDLDL